MATDRSARILIYSHDTFGLGHLRRCRTLAQAIVSRYPNVSVLILSGSPLIGSFEFPTRVDFVRIPGVIKLRDGEYSSLSLHMDISEVLALRESIIHHTASAFRPDIFIVDKEPLGLRGEIVTTLEHLRTVGTRLVLGLRDVMDDPNLLAEEWARKHPLPALRDLYHQIWIYGLEEICNPLSGIDLPEAVVQKIVYTGYIAREVSPSAAVEASVPFDEPFILVTPGGGGDGVELVDRVLSAYELGAHTASPGLAPGLLVFGPFMPARARDQFRRRAEVLENVEVLTFNAQLEALMQRAVGVVAMGGYNTFCEILSFDKPSLILPRRRPRMEQYIRARRAEELGLVGLVPPRARQRPVDARRVFEALNALPARRRPSFRHMPELLSGIGKIEGLLDRELERAASNPGPLEVPRAMAVPAG